MNHPIFDALKISPIPLETANKVTEVGWMLEIEKYINKILAESCDTYKNLSEWVQENDLKFKEELTKRIENYLKDKVIADIYADAITERIVREIDSLLGKSLKRITFGLDDNGYFIAQVPDQYDDIVIGTEENGKLYLEY